MKRPIDCSSDEAIARAISADTGYDLPTSKRRRTTWGDGAAAAAAVPRVARKAAELRTATCRLLPALARPSRRKSALIGQAAATPLQGRCLE